MDKYWLFLKTPVSGVKKPKGSGWWWTVPFLIQVSIMTYVSYKNKQNYKNN